ncbi:MAG: AAA family ATPase [Candidatus Methanofastidiosia archaeon]
MLCVVGMPGCGKDVFLSIAAKYQYPVVSMGDAVRKETQKRGLPLEHHGEIAKKLREEQGLAAVAQLVLDTLTPDSVVDGVRGAAELDLFSQYYLVETLAIHASPQTRFERVKARQREGDPKTWNQFIERDIRELQFGLGDVIALADYMLINESHKEQFESACHAFLTSWRRDITHE